jgi:succinate dehydrogenase / fumarate reductase, membrane anchor subunit
MEMRSHLGRARGLGSSNDGVGHWWLQRVTGVALVPLTLWFVYSAINLAGADVEQFKTWVGTAANPVLLSLLIFTMFHHGQLGLQVVIEDYIHSEKAKLALLIAIKFTAIIFGGYSIYAVLRLTFGG